MTKVKDPDSVVDFGMDWTKYLALENDTITESTWFIAGPPDTTPGADDYLVIDRYTNTDTTTAVWLSGGQLGVIYSVTNRVTTTGGRTDDATVKIKIKEK
jgi:hypothetical protein